MESLDIRISSVLLNKSFRSLGHMLSLGITGLDSLFLSLEQISAIYIWIKKYIPFLLHDKVYWHNDANDIAIII